MSVKGVLSNKKALDSNLFLCQGRTAYFLSNVRHDPRCHLAFMGETHALSGIPAYPRQLTYAYTLQNTLWKSHFTAPSAVHLTICFLPDSQHRRLSVKASLPLSPPQRFAILNYFIIYHTVCSLSRQKTNKKIKEIP